MGSRMLKAAPELVYFQSGELGKQVLSDSSGRRIGELMNQRRLLKATNLADWFILTDPPPNPFLAFISTTLSSFISKGVRCMIPLEDRNPSQLVLFRVRIRLCLWNPVTLQSIDLPVLKLESVDVIHHVLVTANPNHHACCVVLILKAKYILFCHMDDVVDGSVDVCWTRLDYPDNFFDPNGGLQTPEFAAMFDEKSIIVRTHFRSIPPVARILIEPKSLVIMAGTLEIPFLRAIHSRYLTKRYQRQYWVSGPDKQHFVIHVTFGYVEVVSVIVYQIYKAKTMAWSWNILDTCPDAAIFIRGNDQALWCSMSNTEAGNRVYIVHEGVRLKRHYLYTYHIENKTLSRSRLLSQPYWMPIQREDGKAEEEDDSASARGETNNGKDVVGMKLNADILRCISSHLLNPVDYLSIRATNTSCRLVGSAKEWRSVLATCESIGVCPWLMIPSVVDRGVSVMVDPVSGNKYYLNTCWGYDFSGICYSSNGWLLMLNDFIAGGTRPKKRVRLWLYNPITKRTIHLPEHDHFDVFMITCSANSPNCRVVGMSTIQPIFDFIELDWNHSDWEYNWNRGEINGYQHISVCQTNNNPACVQGKYYYFLDGIGGSLASYVYDNVGNMFLFTCHQLILPRTRDILQIYLVAGYNNTVLAILVGEHGKPLRVYEFDRSKVVHEWLEVQDIRNHNIYLSTTTCLCKKAVFPRKGNKIYLPRFHHGHIVHYSLDTRMFHAGEGDSSVLSHYGYKEQLYGSWFEPGVTFKF